jgi:hypothetical protein
MGWRFPEQSSNCWNEHYDDKQESNVSEEEQYFIKIIIINIYNVFKIIFLFSEQFWGGNFKYDSSTKFQLNLLRVFWYQNAGQTDTVHSVTLYRSIFRPMSIRSSWLSFVTCSYHHLGTTHNYVLFKVLYNNMEAVLCTIVAAVLQ